MKEAPGDFREKMDVMVRTERTAEMDVMVNQVSKALPAELVKKDVMVLPARTEDTGKMDYAVKTENMDVTANQVSKVLQEETDMMGRTEKMVEMDVMVRPSEDPRGKTAATEKMDVMVSP